MCMHASMPIVLEDEELHFKPCTCNPAISCEQRRCQLKDLHAAGSTRHQPGKCPAMQCLRDSYAALILPVALWDTMHGRQPPEHRCTAPSNMLGVLHRPALSCSACARRASTPASAGRTDLPISLVTAAALLSSAHSARTCTSRSAARAHSCAAPHGVTQPRTGQQGTGQACCNASALPLHNRAHSCGAPHSCQSAAHRPPKARTKRATTPQPPRSTTHRR